MRLSAVPYSQNITFNNLSSSLSCNQILSDTKLVQQSSAGHIIYTPIIQKIKRNIENIALSYAESYGFNEMLFPVLNLFQTEVGLTELNSRQTYSKHSYEK